MILQDSPRLCCFEVMGFLAFGAERAFPLDEVTTNMQLRTIFVTAALLTVEDFTELDLHDRPYNVVSLLYFPRHLE